MDGKPWHVIAREYFGWLNFLLWPYRAYQWLVYWRNWKPTTASAAAPPPLPTAHHPKVKVVEWHGFEGNGQVAALLWGLGIIIPMFAWAWWKKEHNFHPQLLGTVVFWFAVGCVFFFSGVAYYISKMRTVQTEDAPLQPGQNPTPQQTRLASEHLRVALAAYKEVFKQTENHLALTQLSIASEKLLRARNFDPSVTVVDNDDKERPITHTQDDLAGLFLYMEADLYYKQADAAGHNRIYTIGTDFTARHQRKQYADEEREALVNTRNALEKALRYWPQSTNCLCLLAKTYNGLGEPKKAQAAIQKAYEIDPDDIEVLKLKTAR